MSETELAAWVRFIASLDLSPEASLSLLKAALRGSP